ncbi:MAG TPA: hypothetical protein GXZ49_05220 [Bacteroidetes bacterium]|nr:hypothetical protein [Bacteroidota bacterium]
MERGVKLTKISVGHNSMIEGGVKVIGNGMGNITIGEESYIGVNNILDSCSNITIGNFVHIAGPSTALWCHSSVKMVQNSIPLNAANRDSYRPTSGIIIKDNVYVGGNCTIYPGVLVESYSVVAPNTAVVHNVEAGIMVGGVPAKFIKRLV